MEMNQASLKKNARHAGVVYLIWILTGLFSVIYVPSQITMEGDAVTVGQSILSHEFLFRVSIVNDLLSGALWAHLALVLYRLFRNVDERHANLLIGFVLVQIPAIFFISALNVASLMSLKGELLTTLSADQRQELALMFLRVNEYGVLGLVLFWGLWLFPLALLVYRSHFIPRFLGVWLFVNGIALLVLGLSGILTPEYKDLAYKIAFPLMFGEVAFMLWLLIKGANTTAGEKLAPA